MRLLEEKYMKDLPKGKRLTVLFDDFDYILRDDIHQREDSPAIFKILFDYFGERIQLIATETTYKLFEDQGGNMFNQEDKYKGYGRSLGFVKGVSRLLKLTPMTFAEVLSLHMPDIEMGEVLLHDMGALQGIKEEHEKEVSALYAAMLHEGAYPSIQSAKQKKTREKRRAEIIEPWNEKLAKLKKDEIWKGTGRLTDKKINRVKNALTPLFYSYATHMMPTKDGVWMDGHTVYFSDTSWLRELRGATQTQSYDDLDVALVENQVANYLAGLWREKLAHLCKEGDVIAWSDKGKKKHPMHFNLRAIKGNELLVFPVVIQFHNEDDAHPVLEAHMKLLAESVPEIEAGGGRANIRGIVVTKYRLEFDAEKNISYIPAYLFDFLALHKGCENAV